MFDRFGFNLRKVVPLIAIAAGLVSHSISNPSWSVANAQSPTPTPTASPTPVNTRSLTVTQLLQQASSAGSFTTLAAAVKAAGVGNALKGSGKVTIFAPTDAAFASLPAGTVEKLVKPANRALLARILAYHVAPGEYTSKQLPNGGLKTLGGGISLDIKPGRVIVNDARVVQADILASNGVIHAIDRVLLPREIRQKLGSLK